MDSTGYIRLKADMSVSSKELYAVYCLWCDENGLAPMKQRTFSDFLVANQKKYNLEHTNTVTNTAGRRVWGFLGIEIVARPCISGDWGKSLCTYGTRNSSQDRRETHDSVKTVRGNPSSPVRYVRSEKPKTVDI